MSDVFDYIKSGGKHFIRMADLPVVSGDETLGDGLDLMEARQTQGVLVQSGPEEYSLLLQQHLSGKGGDPAEMQLKELLPAATRLNTIDVHARFWDADRAVEGEYPFRAVLVREDDQIIGLLAGSEDDFGSHFFTKAVLYRCDNGHVYFPPPPDHCEKDGLPLNKR